MGPRLTAPRGEQALRFCAAEEESRLELCEAILLTDSLARKARYLQHALDEARHASMFERRSRELLLLEGRTPLGRPHAECEHLFARYGELGFLAYVHLGEARGRRQFEAYVDYLKKHDAKSAALFNAIVTDERQHERYTRELLEEVAGSPAAARRALWHARRRDAWRRWRALGQRLMHPLYTWIMAGIYFLLLSVALLVRARRPPALARWRP